MLKIRRIVGKSMHPNFKEGRIVFVRKLKQPKINDVVVVSHNGMEYIKRISRIDADKVYVLGDNLDHSTDSRHFGWLSVGSIVGYVKNSIDKTANM